VAPIDSAGHIGLFSEEVLTAVATNTEVQP
jgi:hypothetical protein